MFDALPIPDDHWRSRWLHVAEGDNIHRVSTIAWDAGDDMIAGEGVAVCGAAGRMRMPGMLWRMGARRCRLCCDALGIPRGDGAPGNHLGEPWQHA